jgi:hypothetical protein
MNTDFLNQLERQLKVDKNAACRRTIERILVRIKKRCDEGVYESRTEAELNFRKFVEGQGTCQKSKTGVKTASRGAASRYLRARRSSSMRLLEIGC